MLDASTALARLREGNAKFAANDLDMGMYGMQSRREELLDDQEPFAVILGCSDSRVPVELVFGQGLGDLFVIRVAGNIVAPSQVGSIEFATAQLGTRLVVVLGHSNCGAVKATIDAMNSSSADLTTNLGSIVHRIQPALTPLQQTPDWNNKEQLLHQAVKANIEASVEGIRKGSPLIEEFVQCEGLLIIGAEYDLESGIVTFYEPS